MYNQLCRRCKNRFMGTKGMRYCKRPCESIIISKGFKSISSMHKRRFGGLREFVLARAEYKCEECGMTRREHYAKWNRDLTINHEDGQGRYSEEPNNDPDNLEALCLPCHSRKDYYLSRGLNERPRPQNSI